MFSRVFPAQLPHENFLQTGGVVPPVMVARGLRGERTRSTRSTNRGVARRFANKHTKQQPKHPKEACRGRIDQKSRNSKTSTHGGQIVSGGIFPRSQHCFYAAKHQERRCISGVVSPSSESSERGNFSFLLLDVKQDE